MAHNTFYKHLARHIKELRENGGDPDTKYDRDVLLNQLVRNFAAEMEQRQPGSFIKQTFLVESGAVEETEPV